MIHKSAGTRSFLAAPDRDLPSFITVVRDSAVFLFLLTYFTAVSLLFSDESGPGTGGLSLEASNFWRIVTPIFLGVGIFLLVASRAPTRRMIVLAAPLMPMLIWIILSVMWSDFPDLSIRRSMRLVMETAAVILFAVSYRDQYSLLRVVYLSFGFILMLDIALLSMPHISFTPIGYAGAHFHKNDTGIFCLLALPIFLLAAIDRRIFPSRTMSIALALSCLGILVFSLSKTSMVLTPVCLVLAVGFVWLKRLKAVTTLFAIMLAIFASAFFSVLVFSVGLDAFMIEALGDVTFTGRDRIWQYALSRFWQAPIVGHGFGSLWDVGVNSLLQQEILGITFVLKEGHNGYIDVLAQLGIVGLFLTIVFIISMLHRLWVRIQIASINRISFISIYLCFAIVLINFVESTIFRSSGLWLYFLFAAHAAILITRVRAWN